MIFKRVSRGMLIAIMLAAGSTIYEPARAATLGLDFSGGTTQPGLTSGTFGFRFSISSAQTISGLGFWDLTGSYPQTQVGLWDSNENLLGSVDTSTSTVRSFAANASGFWQFMDISLNLSPGTYTVGASYYNGQSSEAVSTSSISTNILTYVGSSWIQFSPVFQFPTDKGPGNPYLGGNVEFASAVPLPAALPLFASGASVIALLSWRRNRKKAAAMAAA